jgi:hypothetical protein
VLAHLEHLGGQTDRPRAASAAHPASAAPSTAPRARGARCGDTRQPYFYVGQEPGASLSTAPTVVENCLEPRPLVPCAFSPPTPTATR